MMAFYFGRKDAPPEEGLWAEIMFPAWILDGGIILMFLYCGALVVTVRAEYVLSRSSPDPDVQAVSACVLAGNAAIVALCFSFVPFVTQVGLQFWFLSACLRGAIQPSIVGPPTAVLEARVPEWKRLRQGKLRPK